MDDIEKIKSDLVHSCIKLNNLNILDEKNLQKCQKIDDLNYKFKGIGEKSIFGENRNDNINILESFFSLLDNIRETKIKEIKKSILNNDDYEYTKQKNNLLEFDDAVLTLIILTDKKLVNNYYNKENSNYNLLLRNYLKIDDNRLKLSNIGSEYETLNRVNEIDITKLENSSYIKFIVVLFILILVLICVVAVIIKFI